jgi:kinesin family protein 2/24
MGAGDSRNIDKRTVRRQYREAYQGAIETIRHSLETVPASSSGSNANKSRDVKVYIRKRPIFNKEISSGEFDVITCPKSADTEGYGKKLIIHDARIQSDMRHQFINNYEFNFDRVFNESATSYEVYETAAAPLVDIAYNGGYATCLVYGQTGSGKSFTMSSIYEEAAKSIFRLVNSGKAPSIAGNDAKDASSFGDVEVSASFFEISGETISDLLGNFRPAKLISGKEGCTHPLPVLEVPLRDVDELLEMISFARSVRR